MSRIKPASAPVKVVAQYDEVALKLDFSWQGQPFGAGLARRAEVALDDIVAVDHFADLQDFRIGQLIDPSRVGDAHLVDDFACLGRPNAVNVLQRNNDALISRDIDASDTGQSSSPQTVPRVGRDGDRPFVPFSTTKSPPASACGRRQARKDSLDLRR